MKHLARFATIFVLCVGISYLIDLGETAFTGIPPATKPRTVLILSTVLAIMLTATWKFPEKRKENIRS